MLQLGLNFPSCPPELPTHWMIPSVAQPLTKASSPSGCASLAIAAGLTKNGADVETPSIERWVFVSATSRMTRGRSMILR